MFTAMAISKGFELVPDGKVSKDSSGCYQSRVRVFRGAADTESIVRSLLSKFNYCYREDSTGGYVAYKTSVANNAATKTTVHVYGVGDNLTEVSISGSISSGSQLMSFVCKKNVSELVSAIEEYAANCGLVSTSLSPSFSWASPSA